MTDTRPPAASKPMWTRHKPGCGQRIFNDPIDIDNHRRYCPADLLKKLTTLEEKYTALERNLGTVSEQVEAGPAIDPDEIAPWEGDDDSLVESDDEPVVTTEADVESVPPGQYFVDDEDEPDYSTASRSVV